MSLPLPTGILDNPHARIACLRGRGVTPSRTRWWASLWRWLRSALLPGEDPRPAEVQPGANPGSAGEARASTGSAAATLPSFSDFFAQHQRSLLDYLYGMTRDRELAADLVQDTFTKAYVAAPELAGILQPRAWLFTIATRHALNAARHRGRFEWLPLSSVEPEATAAADEAWSALPSVVLPQQGKDDPAATIGERDAVWGVLAELPPRWRAVLLLHAHAGYDVHEIVVMLHLSEANVRKMLFQAKQRFRTLYTAAATRGA